jgi:hypothetical protein
MTVIEEAVFAQALTSPGTRPFSFETLELTARVPYRSRLIRACFVPHDRPPDDKADP